MAIILTIIAIIVLLIASVCLIKIIISNPKSTIEKKFIIQLPQKITIIRYTNKRDICAAKIEISTDDAEKFVEYLNKKDSAYGEMNISDNMLPDESLIVGWWDLKKENIQNCYIHIFTVKFLNMRKDAGGWIYITKSISGNSYIYLCKAS